MANNQNGNRNISDLPTDMRRMVLSFLPTREAAITSSFLRAWRDEYARTTALEFEFPRGRDEASFVGFVNRVLAVRGDNLHLQKFSLRLIRDLDEEAHASGWIAYAVGFALEDLELCFYELNQFDYQLPQNVFVVNTLVRMKIGTSGSRIIPLDVNVHLPNLKKLWVDNVDFGENGEGFYNLVSGCPIIEELVMEDIEWFTWVSSSVSSNTLKRLRIFWEDNVGEHNRDEPPQIVSFETPNLLYLEYNDDIAKNYGALTFDSLVGAKILLHMRDDESSDDEEEGEVNNEDASAFIVGIKNVRSLYLRADTLEVLAFRCEHLPVFHFAHLSQLEIESSPQVGWNSLPNLLSGCPLLQTLIFRGLVHEARETCGDVCRCNDLEEVHSCLEASPVKVLKLFELGQANEDRESLLREVRHFLAKMPHLERLVLICDASLGNDARAQLSSAVRGIQNRASPMCVTQVIRDNQ